tara:strand:- start:109 stop:702 length:594 start_codon:yes stop_codon:yes gene_type:complete
MNKKIRASIQFLIIIIPLAFLSCAEIVVGSAAKVATAQQEERSLGEMVDDTVLKAVIKNTYFDTNEKIFFNVDVEVSQGRVLLTGTVESSDLRIEATRLAWNAKGVKTVINEIQINNDDSILNYADDLVIATKIAGKFVLDDDIQSLNYNIEVVNKNVYLIGIARDEQEREKAIRISKEVFGVEEVIDYIILSQSKE